ncbi:MAG: PQQ-like beta-propeller repeat protein, partial [Planctomycetes bacterium]|nr:PQQ-like beta-propeller repeat protein [Planctomycetota bacterium]
SGKKLWAHFDELDGPRTRRFRGHDSCGPPLIVGDTVYAPVHDRSGAIAFSVAAYDLQTGQPKWRQLVCSSQQDVNMFGNARTEFASSPLALCDGVLYGASNLGVAFALDAADGRLRWITAYDVVRMPPAMLHGQAERQVYFANNAPVVAEGVVCCTPLDSQFALGIDIDTGTKLWRLPYDARVDGIENRVQWLAGALGDEFVLSGAGAVAVLARPEGNFGTQPVVRQLVRPDQLGERRRGQSPGRPAVTATHVWLPGTDQLLAFDRTGEPAQGLSAISLEGYRPGNLLLVDGIAVSLRQRSFDLVLDPTALLAQSERRVQDGGDEPAALLRLAHLRAALLPPDADGNATAAVRALLRRGLAACAQRGLPPRHPTRLALQTELYERALADAEAAPPQDAAQRFAEARDLAPDEPGWLSMQTRVLAAVRGDRTRFLAELERLEREAPGARLPAPLGLPVPMFVLWQRALARADDPTAAVAMWQELLEQYGDVMIGDEPAALLAEQAIAQLITSRGATIYADIAARADAALRAAGTDGDALESVARRFPNSAAAERASLLLLDRAVEKGDLAVAIGVFAQALRGGEVPPGVLRRVQVAADRRGNHALGAAMARRLAAFAGTASDWPADAGRDYADIAAGPPPRPVEPVVAAVPTGVAFRIPPRSQQEYVRLLPTIVAEGFEPPADLPLYVVAGREMVAYDLGADATPGKPLFAVPVDFLEHALVCGETLLVPDMEHVVAVHYRSGERQWALEFDSSRLIDSMGVTDGVLQLTVQPSVPDGNNDLLGIEPLTGTRLFTRSLEETQLRPKPSNGQLLMLDLRPDGPVVMRLDAVDGTERGEVPCASICGPGGLDLRLDSLATRLYPQKLCADAERVYLPIEGHDNSAAPQVAALTYAGEQRWRWVGTTGSELLMAQVRGSHFVVAERNEQRTCRALLLDAASGAVLREADLGAGALTLNWLWSWLDNPAPPLLAFESMLDRSGQRRQLVVFAVDDGPTFAVPLGAEDEQIERAPVFTADAVLFAVRPRRDLGPLKIYGLDLATRRGVFPGDEKYLRVDARGRAHGVAAAGRYTVVSTTQGLLALGPEARERR